MKVKLITQMNIKYNKNFDCFWRIYRMFERDWTSTKVWKTSTKWKSNVITISLCDENHLMLTLMIMMRRAKYQIIIWDFVRWVLLSYHPRSASSSFWSLFLVCLVELNLNLELWKFECLKAPNIGMLKGWKYWNIVILNLVLSLIKVYVIQVLVVYILF